ncbi:MAG: sugar transferase [Candidatus Omnitrophota bacterium]|nr:sugar transferase [Candidatus Omnitrophota bacterium]
MGPYGRWFKRCVDLGLAAGGVFVFALPMGWIAWRLRRELGFPVLFRQTRVGLGRKPFTVLKFRTMKADGAVPSLFCRRLRACALDELPQLVNILRGEMSFVGPRPLIPEELETLEQLPRGADRLLLRPGLTGLAQLHSSKVPPLPERLRWDLAYADRCSLLLDLEILLKSVAVTLRGAWEKP